MLAGQHRLDRRQIWPGQAHADQGDARASERRARRQPQRVEFRKDPNFGFEVPVSVPGVDTSILDPRNTWSNPAEYDAMAAKLVDLFVENFAQFADHVDEGVRQAAPKAAQQQAQPSPTKPPPLNGPVSRSGPPRTRSMTDYDPRLSLPTPTLSTSAKGFSRALCRARNGPHEAHLAATTYLLLRRPEIDLDAELPGLIRRYNESVGGVNSDTEGYHETITRVFLHGVRLFLAEADRDEPLHELVNELLLSPMGRRDWPFRFYSRGRLVLSRGAEAISLRRTLRRFLDRNRAATNAASTEGGSDDEISEMACALLFGTAMRAAVDRSRPRRRPRNCSIERSRRKAASALRRLRRVGRERVRAVSRIRAAKPSRQLICRTSTRHSQLRRAAHLQELLDQLNAIPMAQLIAERAGQCGGLPHRPRKCDRARRASASGRCRSTATARSGPISTAGERSTDAGRIPALHRADARHSALFRRADRQHAGRPGARLQRAARDA